MLCVSSAHKHQLSGNRGTLWMSALHGLDGAWIPTLSTLFSDGIWYAKGSAQAMRQHCLDLLWHQGLGHPWEAHEGGGRNISSSSLHSRWYILWRLCPSLRHICGSTPQPQPGPSASLATPCFCRVQRTTFSLWLALPLSLALAAQCSLLQMEQKKPRFWVCVFPQGHRTRKLQSWTLSQEFLPNPELLL